MDVERDEVIKGADWVIELGPGHQGSLQRPSSDICGSCGGISVICRYRPTTTASSTSN